MTTFIAVQNGNQAQGYLVTNGEAFTARSGSNAYGRGNIPAGDYKVGEAQDVRYDQRNSMAKGNQRGFKKFLISGVGPTNAGGGLIKDKRYPKKPREGIMFHYDGNNPGTEGCIGYDDVRAQTALQNARAAGDKDVHVVYVKSDAEARAMAKKLTGKDPPPMTRGFGNNGPRKPAAKKPKRRKKASQRRGDTSRIRHGARMAQGEPTVVLGQKMLMAAHVDAAHTGGGKVAKGSNSVYVGKRMLAFGRVSDPTTDGSELATGEPSVMVG
jgi:hypothetical protein